jgi:DNA-binding MarR family transcriptional regulator
MVKDTPTQKPNDAFQLTACACANLRKASRAVTQVYDAALQPTGLKATQFTLLATLSTLGDLPLTRLAEALVMDRTTLTRNLKPLIGKGLVDVASGDDQRVRKVGLTPSGRTAFDEALPHWRIAQSRFVEGLGQEKLRDLLAGIGGTVSIARGH